MDSRPLPDCGRVTSLPSSTAARSAEREAVQRSRGEAGSEEGRRGAGPPRRGFTVHHHSPLSREFARRGKLRGCTGSGGAPSGHPLFFVQPRGAPAADATICTADTPGRPVRRTTHAAYPQLFHHRAHRPRQVHARGSPDPACGGLSDREMEAQVLDSMDLERERGITIKAQTAALEYGAATARLQPEPDRHARARRLQLRGSRARSRPAKARCWWSMPRRASRRRRSPTATRPSNSASRSAGPEQDRPAVGRPGGAAPRSRTHRPRRDRRGAGQRKTGDGHGGDPGGGLERVPPPKGDPAAPLQALIFDSWFDNYVGVVMLVRVVDGMFQAKDKILLMATAPRTCARRWACSRRNRAAGSSCRPARSASSSPASRNCATRSRRHGHPRRAAGAAPLPGFKEMKPQVFAGLYPVECEPVRGAARRARRSCS